MPDVPDGYVLTADSALASGQKWAAAAGGAVAAEDVTVDPAGPITATDVQAALEEIAAAAFSADACSAYATSAQGINDTTHTAINLNAELYDSNAMHDNATNNSRITIVTAGIYIVTWAGGLVSNAIAYSLIGAIRVNGDQTIRYGETQSQSTAGAPSRSNGSALIELAVSDYVELVLWQSGSSGSGGAINTDVNANPQRRPMMQVAWLRDTI